MAIQTPVPCQAIEATLKKKTAELNRLNATPTGGGGGPVVKPGQDRDPELEAMKKKLRSEIRALDAKLTQCFVQNTPNSPLTVRFTSLFCGDQDDVEIGPFPEDDEPYLVVYSVNIPNLTNPVPDARAFKIGRFLDVDSGDRVNGSVNVWDTNGNAQRINDPNSVIILVAMMEEDSTGADLVRTTVQTAMPAIVATNLAAAATDPEVFRVRLMEGMAGIIQGVAKAAIGSQDDRIGAIQQIRLTRDILNRVRRFGSHRFDLNFNSASARYTATFQLQLP
jgi:hypothetical protein